MPMEISPCKTVPGVLKARTGFAIVYHPVCLAMYQSSTLQLSGVEHISVDEWWMPVRFTKLSGVASLTVLLLPKPHISPVEGLP
jgi:hypothetical protein